MEIDNIMVIKESQCMEIINEIKEEMNIYTTDDKQSKFSRYNEEDLRDVLWRIEFLLKNNRCWNCNKLVDCGDYDNFECSSCGVGLGKTFGLEKEK